jgi:hypothetical protein
MKERLLIAITHTAAMDADDLEQEEGFVNPHRQRFDDF